MNRSWEVLTNYLILFAAQAVAFILPLLVVPSSPLPSFPDLFNSPFFLWNRLTDAKMDDVDHAQKMFRTSKLNWTVPPAPSEDPLSMSLCKSTQKSCKCFLTNSVILSVRKTPI